MTDGITVYGIKSCDTVRRARKWLNAEGLTHRYHDFREDGLNGDQVEAWLAALGSEALINRRSRTWKNLSDNDKALANGDGLAALLTAYPTLIKRPVIDQNGRISVGFNDSVKERLQ